MYVCTGPDYNKFNVTNTTWDFVTDRHTTAWPKKKWQKLRLCILSVSIAQVVAAVFTGVLFYIGVVLRRRIMPGAPNVEGEEDGANEPLRTSGQQSTEASSVEDGTIE